jgi:hypothetical protein
MFMNPTLNRPLWDLACDIAVENVINDLYLKQVDSKRAKMQQAKLAKIKSEIKILTAEKIYNYIKENLSELEAAELRGYFYADNHEVWYMTESEIAEKYNLVAVADGSKPDNPQRDNKSASGSGNKDGDEQSNNGDSENDGQSGNGSSKRNELNQMWKDISERM